MCFEFIFFSFSVLLSELNFIFIFYVKNTLLIISLIIEPENGSYLRPLEI